MSAKCQKRTFPTTDLGPVYRPPPNGDVGSYLPPGRYVTLPETGATAPLRGHKERRLFSSRPVSARGAVYGPWPMGSVHQGGNNDQQGHKFQDPNAIRQHLHLRTRVCDTDVCQSVAGLGGRRFKSTGHDESARSAGWRNQRRTVIRPSARASWWW